MKTSPVKTLLLAAALTLQPLISAEKAKVKIKKAQEKKDPNGIFNGERPDIPNPGQPPTLGGPMPM